MPGLWITPEELSTDDLPAPEHAQEAAETASYLLWALSGRKYSGITTVTERYVRQLPVSTGYSTENANVALFDGEIINIPSSVSSWVDPQTRVRLRGRPVISVQSVTTVGGPVIDPTTYQVVDHSVLQLNALSYTDIEVTYTYGTVPPAAGRMAARELALEFVKAWSGDETCGLPERVTSVSRAGMSYTILDSQDFITDLRTGVYSVDLFLKTVNPDKARARSRVFSPDTPRARRVAPAPAPLLLGDWAFVPTPSDS